jgi:hypothetical protein
MCKCCHAKHPTLAKVSNVVKATIPAINFKHLNSSEDDDGENLGELTEVSSIITTFSDSDSDSMKLEGKCVTFDTLVTVRLVRSRKDYTPQEIACSWYSEEEEKKIRASCLKQIIMIEKGMELEEKEVL